jgi:cell division protein FtsB
MQERMMSDKEKSLMEMQERQMYISKRTEFAEREKRMFNMITTMLVPMLFIIIFVWFGEPAKNLMIQYERILSAEASGMERIPELKKQISILEKQLATLTNQSIESRLATIEKSIAIGDVDVSEIATLQNLKVDFDVLKSYMFSDPEDLVKLKTLQRDYQEISGDIQNYVHKDVVDREISFLTNLFYTVLGFLGILISIVGTSWYSTTKKLKSMNGDES